MENNVHKKDKFISKKSSEFKNIGEYKKANKENFNENEKLTENQNDRHGENRKIPRARKNIEMKICGIHACKKVFEKRPQDIIRAYVTEENVQEFKKILKYCADNKLAYRVITEDEIVKVSESNHHEGICLLIKKTPILSFQDFLKESHKGRSCVVALENVQNPHNLGAIMRVCANFGVNAILVSHTEAAYSGSAYRTSEGGAEFIKVVTTDNFEKAIQAFRKNDFKILTTSSHTGKSLFEEKLPAKMLVVFGSEGSGLSPKLLHSGDKTICIPSTGNVESLNIACAASIILAEFWRGNY